MKPVKKSVLLTTSVASDVQHAGGVLTIGGLQGIRANSVLDIKQIKYKAEVSQVVKIAYSLSTPTADTKYAVRLEFLNSTHEGFVGVTKTYAYTTPSVLTNIGATAALQREYIHLNIVAKVNADLSVPVTAASLLTGTGLTLTDDAGYYPATLTGRKGPTNVVLVTNADGSGWVDTSAENTITTTGVIGFGVGATMLANAPVISGYFGGNLISGSFDSPKTAAGAYATSGQNYDAFIVSALQPVPANAITGQLAYIPVEYAIFVDNGTGSATTNLTGFKAFEREMLREMYLIVYGEDPRSVIEFFDKGFLMQADTGVSPYTGTLAGTANVLDVFMSPYGMLNHTNIGTQTIFSPALDATGLLIDQDDTATEGAHYSANQQTLGVQSFIVGKTEFSVSARVVMADVVNSHFQLGFRKKAAYTADYNDYTDLASIGTRVSGALGAIATAGILNNAATVNTVSSAVLVNAVSSDMVVKVAIDGTVTCLVDNVSYPVYSVGTTALIFDAGDEMIPFFQHVNVNSANAGVVISRFAAVAAKDWRL
jgi:hypothetical protein